MRTILKVELQIQIFGLALCYVPLEIDYFFLPNAQLRMTGDTVDLKSN